MQPNHQFFPTNDGDRRDGSTHKNLSDSKYTEKYSKPWTTTLQIVDSFPTSLCIWDVKPAIVYIRDKMCAIIVS